jgi:hypothetical protein
VVFGNVDEKSDMYTFTVSPSYGWAGWLEEKKIL